MAVPGAARHPVVRCGCALLLAVTLAASAPGIVLAQEDVGFLDVGHPIRVTDAHPKPTGRWQARAGFRAEWSRIRRSAEGHLALDVGVPGDVELGLGVKPTADVPVGTGGGLGGLVVHALHRFRGAGKAWPALAARVGVETPLGGARGRDEWGGAVGLVATGAIGWGLRLHVNGAYVLAGDGGDHWSGGVALDRALDGSSALLVADAYTEVPVSGGSARVWTEVGVRMPVSERTVLDVGVGSRVDRWLDDEENGALVVGFSRSFGDRDAARGRLRSLPGSRDPR